MCSGRTTAAITAKQMVRAGELATLWLQEANAQLAREYDTDDTGGNAL